MCYLGKFWDFVIEILSGYLETCDFFEFLLSVSKDLEFWF